MKTWFLRRLENLLQVGLLLGAIATLLSYAGTFFYQWQIDLFSHFHLQLGLGCLAVAGGLLLFRSWLLAGLGLLLSAAHWLSVSYYFMGSPVVPKPEGAPTLSVLTFNVLASNQERSALWSYLTEDPPDVVLLQEIDREWARFLAQKDGPWEHKYLQPRGRIEGHALLSRFPLKGMGMLNPNGTEAVGIAFATIQPAGAPAVRFFSVHPLPSLNAELEKKSLHYLEALAEEVAREEGLVVVAGDFNRTPWSPPLAEFLKTTALVDVRRGGGFPPTWKRFTLLGLPIDHLLVSRGISVLDQRVGPALGSDHHPVRAELALP
ncbi:MAG: endonuclease/exonuclease/phosphatase family protein [Verrucomicrobiota bacterium]